MLVVDSGFKDPYKFSSEYVKKTSENNVNYQGKIYETKIIYEKNISVINRLVTGVLALYATVTIIPYLLNSVRVSTWWQQALSGVDRKIVLIEKKTPEKHVHFGKVRARCFNKNEPPAAIRNIPSIELKDSDKSRLEAAKVPQQRKIPPLSCCDTKVFNPAK